MSTHAPVVIPVDPETERSEWLAWRRRGLGSSDMAAILGMDRFRSPYAVWVDKVEDLPEQPDSAALRWGRRLEDDLADEFSDEHDEYLVKRPGCMYQHAELPYMLASPDRLLYGLPGDGDGGFSTIPVAELECKTSALVDEWEDAPPDRVLVQVQHQLCVLDMAYAYVAVLVFPRRYREWRVERDEATITVLLEAAAEFDARVKFRNPPALDGHAGTSEAIARLYRSADLSASIDIGERGRALLAERAHARALVADLERDVDRIENELKVLLGERTVGLIDGRKAFSWNPVKGRIDMERAEKERPDLVAELEQFRKEPSRRLYIAKEYR